MFGLAGVFTNPQFQVVIRALNQKKGIDLLSAPSVTTKSGQRAIIEVIRELRYPRTYTPPQVPTISSRPELLSWSATAVPVVVTPTTPRTWETRNTGVTWKSEPVVGGDATTIDLNLIPQVVEFEGFINYGSPIFAVESIPMPVFNFHTAVLLTANVINQPVFSTRKVTTSVSVYDGQTVVLGGLMREDVQKTEDKVPIIGDIPLVGRAFRTNTEQHIKKNLVIFVTAKIVTPAGCAVERGRRGRPAPAGAAGSASVQEVTQASSLHVCDRARCPLDETSSQRRIRPVADRMHVLRDREDHHARGCALERGKRERPPPAGAARSADV